MSASTDFRASGVVALTTDFGLSDPYVGMMKGVLLARAPRATIVDVTHGVPAQDVRAGAFFLAHAARYFAPGTVHLAVVDPGVGSSRRLLVAFDRGQAFLAPDNGLLSEVLSAAAEVFELDADAFALEPRSRTFHGRDVLAPSAAALVHGTSSSLLARRPAPDWMRLEPLRPRRAGESVEACVLCVDRYGNLVLAATEDDLPAAPDVCEVVVGDERIAFVATYADAAPGALLALVDSYAALEIAVRDGDAARRLALSPGDRVVIRRRA